jgi:hypothetical protein
MVIEVIRGFDYNAQTTVGTRRRGTYPKLTAAGLSERKTLRQGHKQQAYRATNTARAMAAPGGVGRQKDLSCSPPPACSIRSLYF